MRMMESEDLILNERAFRRWACNPIHGGFIETTWAAGLEGWQAGSKNDWASSSCSGVCCGAPSSSSDPRWIKILGWGREGGSEPSWSSGW